jgi:hypothetical protein
MSTASWTNILIENKVDQVSLSSDHMNVTNVLMAGLEIMIWTNVLKSALGRVPR